MSHDSIQYTLILCVPPSLLLGESFPQIKVVGYRKRDVVK